MKTSIVVHSSSLFVVSLSSEQPRPANPAAMANNIASGMAKTPQNPDTMADNVGFKMPKSVCGAFGSC
jgi:hypothetical protein